MTLAVEIRLKESEKTFRLTASSTEKSHPLFPLYFGGRARTESDSSAIRTLVTTLPQTIVDKVKLESTRRSRTLIASRFPLAASTSRRSLLTLKIARLSPEKTADCVTHNAIPVQMRDCAMDAEIPDVAEGTDLIVYWGAGFHSSNRSACRTGESG